MIFIIFEYMNGSAKNSLKLFQIAYIMSIFPDLILQTW